MGVGFLKLGELRIKLFADGADAATMIALCANPLIRGFTTNPTMMRADGVREYETFARSVLEKIGDRPISFEVFADDEPEMERQARKIASWPGNVYVKIPVTNTRGESTANLVRRLTKSGIRVNVTAIMTLQQLDGAREVLAGAAPACASFFAGRVADTGRDPVPLVREAVHLLQKTPNIELIWASPREILNVFHAESAGAHIITLTKELLAKLPLLGKDLDEFSLETVQMFREDAQRADLSL